MCEAVCGVFGARSHARGSVTHSSDDARDFKRWNSFSIYEPFSSEGKRGLGMFLRMARKLRIQYPGATQGRLRAKPKQNKMRD
jgi:hypothetical protein